MTVRFLAVVTLVVCCLATGAGIAPATAAALVVDARAQPYFRSFTCPRTLVPQLPNTNVPCP